MNKNEIIPAIIREHKAGKKQSFPDHVVAQAAMVSEPLGVLIKETITYKYSTITDPLLDEMVKARIRQAAIRTAAACIRFLEEFNH